MSDDFLSYFRTHAIPNLRDMAKNLAATGETCWLGIAREVFGEARQRGAAYLPEEKRQDLQPWILHTVAKEVGKSDKLRSEADDLVRLLLKEPDPELRQKAIREFSVADDVSKAKHNLHHAQEARREQAATFWQQGIVLGRQQRQTDAQQQQGQSVEQKTTRLRQ